VETFWTHAVFRQEFKPPHQLNQRVLEANIWKPLSSVHPKALIRVGATATSGACNHGFITPDRVKTQFGNGTSWKSYVFFPQVMHRFGKLFP
jgi:hypothetical protein